MSYRPSPADMVSYGYDPDRIRKILKRDLEAAKHCHVDITLKDVETVQSDPDRVRNWVIITRQVLFTRRKDEATELWRIPAEGGEPQNLGLTMRKIEHLSLHSDGRRIVFTGPGPRPGNEVWAMENILSTSTASR